MRNLLYRIVTALVLLPVVILSFFFGGFYLKFLLLLVGLISSIEISQMVISNKKIGPFFSFILWIGILLPLVYVKSVTGLISSFFSLFFLLNFFFLFSKNLDVKLLEKYAITFYFSFYVFIAIFSVSFLRDQSLGLPFILCAFIATCLNDIAAYFGGKIFGKRPLFFVVSQKKTWEGFCFGSLAALMSIPLIKNIEFFSGLSLWDIILVVVPSIALAPLGDLMESKLKRMYHTKDSSNILPGHGGILDRIDGLLLVLPWTMVYAIFIR